MRDDGPETLRMKHRLLVAMALALATTGQVMLGADGQGLPVRNGRPAVATVNDDFVYLDELVMQLDPPVDRRRLLGGLGTPTELAILERLIASRLIALEASSMGIGDLAEIRKQVDVYSRQALRETLLEHVVKDVTADEKAVETAFKDLVREWKTVSLLFDEEAAANAALEEIAKGTDYETVAADVVAGKKAKSTDDAAFHGRKEYLPEIVAALTTLELGHVSPVIRTQNGFVVLKVIDIRYPENESARAEATRAVLTRQQQEAIHAHEEALRADLVVIDQEVLDRLDYEATEMNALLKDTRVLASIKGAAPVTVADLTDYMRMQFFHGADGTGQGKRLNARKVAALDATIGRRLFNAEALRLELDNTDAYLDRVNSFE